MKVFSWFKRLYGRIGAVLTKRKNASKVPTVPVSTPVVTKKGGQTNVPKAHPALFYFLTCLWFALMGAGVFIAVAMWDTPIGLLTEGDLSFGQFILGVIILWSAFSVRILLVNEIAGVFLFGYPMIQVRGGGPRFIIRGPFQLQRFSAITRQNQFPDEPEFVQKTPDAEPLKEIEVTNPDGTKTTRKMVRPIRITSARPTDAGKEDILNVQMTLEFSFWVRWKVVDPFLFIMNADGDDASVIKQMRDKGETCLNSEVTKRTPATLISQFEAVKTSLETAVTGGVKGWGIEVVEVGMTAPDINHDVAAELRNIPVTKAKAVQVKALADAEQYRLALEGKGRGKAREEELAGEGRGYKRAAASIGVDPSVVLQAQVARDTIGQGDVVLGTDGLVQALGLGKLILKKGAVDNGQS